MASGVRLADLQAMTPIEREQAVSRLAAEALGAPNGRAVAVAARIRGFEKQYEVSSDTLLSELRAGSRKETAEVAEWLFLLQLQRREAGAR